MNAMTLLLILLSKPANDVVYNGRRHASRRPNKPEVR